MPARALSPAELPDDVADLKRLLRAQAEHYEAELARLREQLNLLLAKRYGPSSVSDQQTTPRGSAPALTSHGGWFADHLPWINPEKARYYQVVLDRDLFGDWTLIKVWRGIGSNRRRMHSTGVASYESAVEEIDEIARRRVQRGYASATAQ